MNRAGLVTRVTSRFEKSSGAVTRVTLLGLGHTGHKNSHKSPAKSHGSHRMGHKTELEFITLTARWRTAE